MAKKPLSVTIRKASSAPPSEAAKPADRDSFVAGATASSRVSSTVSSTVSSKAGFRALTLYLPDALVEKLAAHCKTHDRDMSALVSEVLEQHLAGIEVKEQPKGIESDDPVTALVRWVQGKFTRVAALRPAWLF
ncbi:MAG: hypothetical protein HYV09_17370 [Deltaproteobacteria bacterium]|nr:hypothetical protein [Deltaproteobacteria bacterium]